MRDRQSRFIHRASQTPQRSDRPTLALFSAPLNPFLNYEKRQMWLGVEHVARQRGAHALYLAGGHIEFDTDAQLYDLLDPELVDGIISFASFVSSLGTTDQIHTFFEHYAPLPVLNVAWIVPGVHNLALNEHKAMHDTVDHLIQVHNCRRIAYVGRYPGRLGFEDRYQAFEQVMIERGIVNPALVIGGMQSGSDGRQLVQNAEARDRWVGSILQELDDRGLYPVRDYEAIVASGDLDAIQTIKELQARGIRVPEDVIVTGFRDGQEARIADPPLTTVRMPWYEAGAKAAQLVLDAIEGIPLPIQTYLPMELVIRQSCGCQDPLASSAIAGCTQQIERTPTHETDLRRQEILDTVTANLGRCTGVHEGDRAARLYDSFWVEISHQQKPAQVSLRESSFLAELNGILHKTSAANKNVLDCHRLLSAMRCTLLPHLDSSQTSRAEDLWQEARVIISQAAVRAQAQGEWTADQRRQVLHEIETALLTATDTASLLDILADRLPRLGIRRCYLSLYEDPAGPLDWARLVLAYDRQGRIALPKEGLHFPARQLVPLTLLPAKDRYSLIVNALHVGQEHLGIVALASDLGQDTREDSVCDTLCRQISSALKGVQLRQEAIEARQAAEQADHLKSRFLSSVSHELRTPLNLLVSLSEMTSQQLASIEAGSDSEKQQQLQHCLEQIRNSAFHLDHLILDVLDLARSQMDEIQLNWVSLDLRELLVEIGAIGESLAQQKALRWTLNVPEALPLVNGDRTRLRQVILNLINNAVKFTARGEVALCAQSDESYVTVLVRDTGLGVALEDQETIFDEFQQAERTVARGHGGMGLGLAISKRLVELHGGTIGVRSSGQEGHGSTFFFTVPTSPEQDTFLSSHAMHKETTVLLLVKDVINSASLRDHLVQHGFRVDTVSPDQCDDWLAQIVSHPPDAVVLDAALASVQGWDIVKSLKEHPSTLNTPIQFYSIVQDTDSGSLIEVDYVAKDAAMSQLAQALRRHGLADEPDGDKAMVLIVDDDPGLLEVYTAVVQTHLAHCRVLWAENGLQALQSIQKESPDIVLLDLMMPTMDGFEVLEALRQRESTRSIPVIVLTGQTLTAEDIERLNQGVAAILGKGMFSAEETVAQIEAALNRTKSLSRETQQLVRRAMGYIHTAYVEAISCAEIAQRLNVSQDHLIRCFSRETGITPVTYLNRWRIKQARVLLETSARSMTDIALATGFSSQAYFSRVFKAEMGLPPTAYRRSFRQGKQTPPTA